MPNEFDEMEAARAELERKMAIEERKVMLRSSRSASRSRSASERATRVEEDIQQDIQLNRVPAQTY